MTEPYLAVTVELLKPISPSSGPFPLFFENNVVPCSSNTWINDPRSSALPIAMASLPEGHSELSRNDATDPYFVEHRRDRGTVLLAGRIIGRPALARLGRAHGPAT